MYSLDFLYLFVTLFMSKYIYSQKQRSHGIYHSLLGTHIHINYNNLCVYICLYVCFVCVYVCWERLICALLNCPHLAICNISNLLYFHKIHIQNEPQITIIFLEIKQINKKEKYKFIKASDQEKITLKIKSSTTKTFK